MKDIKLERLLADVLAVKKAESIDSIQRMADAIDGTVGVACRSACYEWALVDYERACRLILEHFPKTHFTIGKVEYQIVITL